MRYLKPDTGHRAAWRRRTRSVAGLALLAVVVACGDNPGGPRRPKTGSLAIALDGLPQGVSASVVVTGPGGYSRQIISASTLPALVPGEYIVTASTVITRLSTFEPTVTMQTITVGAADTAATAHVLYTVTTGSMEVLLAGVPTGAVPKVTVSGPDGFRDSVSASDSLGNLKPGLYVVSSGELFVGPNIYSPWLPSFVVAVAASVQPTAAVMVYALASGSLSINVNGLPTGVAAAVSISGPSDYQRNVATSITIEGLRQGRYMVSSAGIASNGNTYTPAQLTLTATVAPGETSSANVNYALSNQPPGLNLLIDAIQVQQVVQAYGGTVPLIGGRDALLRVFAKASATNTLSPDVRVRFYDGGTLVSTATIPAPSVGVPTVIDEGSLTSSWNYPIPASLMRPGLRILADIDPGNAVAESIESDNTYPSSGSSLALDVRQTSPIALRLVPVAQSINSLVGNIGPANVDPFTDVLKRIFPINTLNVELHPTFSTNAPALQPNDANGAWLQILNEINALRAADGSAAQYYGVVKTSYLTGIIGIGFVPGGAAIGWDVMPNAAETIAHELGHNFRRFHSPCGVTNGNDSQYPYAGGTIGVFGYDFGAGILRDPTATDIMGYCTNRWISDYTYVGILNYRASQSSTFTLGATGAGAPRPGLLIWGRISGGRLILEPTFEVVAPPRLPARLGNNQLELLGSAGELLIALSFDGERVADGTDPAAEHFAYVVPLDALRNKALARLRLSAPSRRTELSAPTITERYDVAASRVSAREVRLSWKDQAGRGLLVRDVRSGAILSFARGGIGIVRTPESQLDITLSDGVRSVLQRVSVSPRSSPRK